MVERSILRSLGLLSLFCGSTVLAGSESVATGKVESIETSVCRLIESSARTQSLPVAFLTRVIWQESSFRPNTISPAGAQGIAQFMPKTADERGLANPFDPEEATASPDQLRICFGRRHILACAVESRSSVDLFSRTNPEMLHNSHTSYY